VAAVPKDNLKGQVWSFSHEDRLQVSAGESNAFLKRLKADTQVGRRMSVRPFGSNYPGRIELARGNGTVMSGQRTAQSVNFIHQRLMRRERG